MNGIQHFSNALFAFLFSYVSLLFSFLLLPMMRVLKLITQFNHKCLTHKHISTSFVMKSNLPNAPCSYGKTLKIRNPENENRIGYCRSLSRCARMHTHAVTNAIMTMTTTTPTTNDRNTATTMENRNNMNSRAPLKHAHS